MYSSSRLPEGLVIPDHHLERRIGEGGYGEIWLARNVIGTYRAVKIVFRSRFESPKPYEREFTGLKAFEPVSRNHPGFVDILQVGRNDEAGYIYYVMELADDEVSGRTVDPDTYSAKNLARERDKLGRLPPAECLRIAKSLTTSLAHLHKSGLVHRDIKPSNIIFVNGEPKLADVGLVVSMSEANTFVGSDGYIPPEGPGTIQADIFSLGKLLYEISTGQDKNQFPELPRDIATFEDSALLLELNEVILKAGENDKRQRYQTADEVNADLELIAGGGSVKQFRFVQRQLTRVRRVAGVAIAMTVLSVAFLVVVAMLRQKERRALATAHVTNGIKLVEDGNAGAAVPAFTAALRIQQNDPAATEAHRLRIGSALERSPKLLQFWEIGKDVRALKFSPDGTHLLAAGGKFVRIYNADSGTIALELPLNHDVNGADFSPDGKKIAVANGYFVTMFNAATGDEFFEIKKRNSLSSAAFSPDGQLVVMGSGGSTAFVIDASNGAPSGTELKGHLEEVRSASFSPDGKYIVTASNDGTGRLWDAKTHELIAPLPHRHWVLDAAFTPDGKHVATSSSDNSILLWKVSAQPQITARMESHGGVNSLSFSPDGHWLAAASLDHTVKFWEVSSSRISPSAINMHSPGLHAVYSPDGTRIATGEQSGRVNLWRIPETAPLNVGLGIVSANDERYVTFSSNSFRVWNARNDSPLTSSLNVTGVIASVSSSFDGQTVAACVPIDKISSTIHVHDLDTRATRSIQVPSSRPSVLLSPDGKQLLVTNGNVATIYSTLTGKITGERQDFTQRVTSAVFSPDSRFIAIQQSRSIRILDAATGLDRVPPLTNSQRINSLAFTPDASRLAVAWGPHSFLPGGSTIWDVNAGVPEVEFKQHMDGVRATVFTPDGRIAATAGEDSLVFVWNAQTGQALLEARRLSAKIFSLRFSQDGRWIAACAWNEAQLWDVETGRALTAGYSIPGQGRFDQCGIVAGKGRLWVQGSRGLYFWDLPQATGDADELVALAYQLGIMIPVGIPWKPEAYPLKKLRERCAEERQRAPARTTRWHEQQARLFENPTDPDWFAARFHLEQLLKRNPESADLRARLAVVVQNLGMGTKPAETDSETQ